MRLLDDGPDLVEVYTATEGEDAAGNPEWTPGEEPVTVRCRVQPVRSEESLVEGLLVGTFYRVIARSWPGGPFDRVEWDGREWDVDGEPMWSRGSETTRHVTVMLRARDPAPSAPPPDEDPDEEP